ncbi:MAG: flavodoxin family protein [Candidatus Thorarchaeota archaeon]
MTDKQSDVTVLGIVGSPRVGGNTDILVDHILAGAIEAGAHTEKIVLRKLTILPCESCDICRKTGKCKQNDDMSGLLEKMERSSVWVLGTPVYWWGPTAQMKAFVDRWYGAKYQEFKGKDIILAIPSGGGNDSYARHIVGMFSDIADYIRMNLAATVLAPGVGSRGSIRTKQQILDEAQRVGREVVSRR